MFMIKVQNCLTAKKLKQYYLEFNTATQKVNKLTKEADIIIQ